MADDSGEGAGVYPQQGLLGWGGVIVIAIGVCGAHGGGDGVGRDDAAGAMTAEDDAVFVGGVFADYPLHDGQYAVGIGGEEGAVPLTHDGLLAACHLGDVWLLAVDVGEDDDIIVGGESHSACLYLFDVCVEI